MTSRLLAILPGLRRGLLALGLLFVPLVAFAADKSSAVSFDVPAGDAAATLKQFAEQSGQAVVYMVDAVRGVRTNAVKGSLAPREALEQLLAGSKLHAVADEKTGALSVTANGKNDPRAVPPSGNRPQSSLKVEDGVVLLNQVEVTGTRLRGLLDGATAQPMLTIDSAQIDRTGAQTIGDLLRYIPQVSSFTTGQGNIQATSGSLINTSTGETIVFSSPGSLNTNAGNVSATIRGAPPAATLLLIDGKRVPKNNQSFNGDGFDLNGIPLAAVERIEVLLDGASSIYGADALGGVINVVLKKNYQGTEVRLGYENTFDSDVGVRTASLTHGFQSGRFRGLLVASWEKANTMAMRDRDFLASFDRRPWGGSDQRNFVVFGGAGTISSTTGAPLPGLTTSSAAVPSGTNGTNLTVTDYANAGALPGPFDFGPYTHYAASYERHSVLARLNYGLRTWLELTAEARLARDRNYSVMQPVRVQNVTIPAGYPGNPFGIPIRLAKWFTDVLPERVASNETKSFSLGASGRLPRNWRYDATISVADNHLRLNTDANVAIGSAAIASAFAAGRTLNLFYDSTRVRDPNAVGDLKGLTTGAFRDEEQSQIWTYSMQADGPIFDLPSGPVSAAFGLERREEYVDFPLRVATDTLTARSDHNQIFAYFAETNVPLLGRDRRLPFAEQLNLSASYRYEEYEAGASARNPRAGLAWRPTKWLLLRGSYGEGFKAAPLQRRNAPIVVSPSSTVPSATNLDPLRGNTVNPQYPSTSGGKSDLLPEGSENTTAGLVAEIPALKGLSLSFDWFDNTYNNRVTTLTFNQMVLLFPERITRGANLPTDQPGWAGAVVAADLRPINVSYSQTVGYDLGLKFDRSTAWGDVLLSLAGSKYTRNILVPSPDRGPAANINTDSLPVQVNGQAFLTRPSWGVGVLATYREANRTDPSRRFTPSAIRWDAQFNYDFSKSAWVKNHESRWLRAALRDTKISLTIYNALDRRPPLDFSAFPDNTVLDSRMRRYALSLRRAF